MRLLGGKEGQNLMACLVVVGEELLVRSRREKEEEESMTVWACEKWEEEKKKARNRRAVEAMVCLRVLSNNDPSGSLSPLVPPSFHC